jgi:molybdenum cofactor biosynthesis enzyme MoaA
MREPMTTTSTDVKPADEIRFLRASVADKCNLNCVYCPKASGMENQVPSRLAGQRLSTAQYCRALDRIAASGVIRGVSFTGGEPTLNRDLPLIVEHARGLFDRVELTTNGRHLPAQIDALAANLDVIKVSLDSTDRDQSHEIMRGRREDHDRALNAIRLSLAAGLNVGVNIVAMRRNLDQLGPIVELARKLRAEAPAGTMYVSLLDLYYTDETRHLWMEEFVPLDTVAQHLRERFGDTQSQDRGGCAIDWFDDAGVQIRLKSSYDSTYRSDRCTGCPVYCQEGMYGLKLSVEGWVTPCPTGSEEHGVHLSPDLGDDQAAALLEPWMRELSSTRQVPDSFATFLSRRDLLHPQSTPAPKSTPARRMLPISVTDSSGGPGCA